MATTCLQLGCGDHGVCNEYQMCACTDGWVGRFCEVPPQNAKCEKSDDAFRAAHKNGDLACGNYGVYGMCTSNGTCDCTNIEDNPISGTRCEVRCTADEHCGSAGFGTCDLSTKRCVCQNGWTGVHCKTPPPPPATCKKDADCGWGGVSRGACDTVNKKCVCIQGGKGFIYGGNWCETVLDPLEANQKNPSVARSLLDSLLTPTFLVNYVLDEVSEKTVEYLLSKGFATLIKDAVMNRLSSTALTNATITLAGRIGASAAMKSQAVLALKTMLRALSRSMAAKITSGLVKGVFGKPIWVLTALQGVGMLLDGFDVRGLNLQMGQSMLDMVQINYEKQFNASQQMVDAGVFYPTYAFPEDSVEWNIQVLTTSNQNDMLTDMGDYITRLSVNSDGQDIVAQPSSPVAAYRSAIAEAQTRPLYKMLSGGNAARAAWLKTNEIWFWSTVGGAGLIILVTLIAIVATRKKDAGVS